MAVYNTDVNKIRFREWTDSLDLAARAEEDKRKAAIARIETVTVRIKRQVVSTNERGEDKPHAPMTVSDVIKQLWRQHFIALEEERLQMPAGGIDKYGRHSITVLLGDGDARTEAQLSVELQRR